MLVLQRRIGESIEIADNIVVTIKSIRGDKVKLGITAPIDVVVNRSELADRIRQDDKDARQGEPT